MTRPRCGWARLRRAEPMGGGTPTMLTCAIRAALGLLVFASLGAGDGPPSRPNPPGASASLPPALAAEVRPPEPESNRTPSRGALAEVGSPLIPGQIIEPIDLSGALRLAGARDLDIGIARPQVDPALAEMPQARTRLLPSPFR